MRTFAQLSFVCFTLIGFGLSRLWVALRPRPRSPLADDDRKSRLTFAFLVGGAAVAAMVSVYTYEYVPSSELPRWLTSPILLLGTLGCLAGILASFALTHMDTPIRALAYGIPTLVVFVAGFFSADVAALIQRVTAVQTQYLSLTLASPADARSPLSIEYKLAARATPFTSTIPFSLGVDNVHAIVSQDGTASRDSDFIDDCVLNSSSHCPAQSAQRSAQAPPVSGEQSTSLEDLVSDTRKLAQLGPLAQCLVAYAAIYPNGLPVQHDLYRLSTPLARSSPSSWPPARLDSKEIDTRLHEWRESDPQVVDLVNQNTDLAIEYLLGAENVSSTAFKEFIEFRSTEIQISKTSLTAILHELKATSILHELKATDCDPAIDADNMLNNWRSIPRNPYKSMVTAFIVTAAGYPHEAALFMIRYLENEWPSVKEQMTQNHSAWQVAVVDAIVRMRMLNVLNALLQVMESHKDLIHVLSELSNVYLEWLRLHAVDISPDSASGWMCGDNDTTTNAYFISYLSARSRLLYFLGSQQADLILYDRWSDLAHKVSEELMSYALRGPGIDVRRGQRREISTCFATASRHQRFRRDALLGAAYAKIGLARLFEEDGSGESRSDAYLRDARLALLNARQITDELQSEQAKEEAQTAAQEGRGSLLARVLEDDSERRTLKEINELLRRLRGA